MASSHAGMTDEPRPRRPADRAWLDVPFEDKDAAKSRGAQWDPQARRWYAPRPGMLELMRWDTLPELLPTEDRTFGNGLYVDLIPKSSWFRNVRSAVDATDWHRIRTMVYSRAHNRCETCGRRQSDPVRLHCHERFDYAGQVQRLKRLLCVCADCHQATHFGHAQLSGKAGQALTHLMTVTGMTQHQAEAHIAAAFTLWEQRSKMAWILDLRMIEVAGVTVRDPEAPAQNPQPQRNPGERYDGTSVTITEGLDPFR